MAQEPRMNLRVTEDLKQKYIEYCESLGTTYADDLRRYMTKCVKDMQKTAK
jgi:antitoxin component of RelBE/YafQ-DinJ toxin-antitoxin module